MHSWKYQMLEDYEYGWRVAGAIGRENEGPPWMRMHIIAYRMGAKPYTQDDAVALRDRPSHQMM